MIMKDRQERLESIDANYRRMQSLLEAMRREQPSIDSKPLSGPAFDAVSSKVDIVDYSTACNMIDTAVSHLDEGLPNGQVVRCSVAMTMLLTGVTLLNRWMALKGFCTHGEDLHNLMNGVSTPAAELRVPMALVDDRDPSARKMISGQHLEVRLRDDGEEDIVVTTSRVVENEQASGLSIMQMTYNVVQMGNGPEPRPTELMQTRVVSHHEVHLVPSAEKSVSSDTTIEDVLDDPSTWKFNIPSAEEIARKAKG
jgi:hypothetical protein